MYGGELESAIAENQERSHGHWNREESGEAV